MPIEDTVSSVINQLNISLLPQSLQILQAIAPFALLLFFFKIFWELWVNYVQGINFLNTKYTVLEIKLPKDTFKSPQAMEIFLNSLHNTADGSLYAQYWNGETRPWYSLEIISIEGQVKFMIWTEDKRKTNLMSALYSQYPDVEIKEVPDYAQSVHFDPKKIRIWAAEFKLSSKDPSQPIKTYVDYGLDKDPKEEFKVDPLLPMLEFLGSLGPNQQVWIQLLIRAHKDDTIAKGSIFKKTDSWKDAATDSVNKILMRDPKTKVAGTKDEATGFTKLPTISEGEKKVAEAIERRQTKFSFDVGIRALYITKKELFNTPFGVGGIISSFKHFSAPHMNGFKPNGDVWHNRIDSPWQDFKDMRRNRYGKLGLMAYKRRSYFYEPFQKTPLIMNSEELATIFHLPGSVSRTPTLERVASKKAEAPGNLPI